MAIKILKPVLARSLGGDYPNGGIFVGTAPYLYDSSDASYVVADSRIGSPTRGAPTVYFESWPAFTTANSITLRYRASSTSDSDVLHLRQLAHETRDPSLGDLAATIWRSNVTLTKDAAIHDLSYAIWPVPDYAYNTELLAQYVPVIAGPGLAMNYWSINGSYPDPDWSSTVTIYEAWLEIDYVAPAITGADDGVKRIFY